MRYFIMLMAAALGALLIAAAFLLPRGGVAPSRPNVVVVLIDTLRADRVHAERNGIPVMPKLAALAREGRVFTHAYSPASWTRPSIASIFTGQYVDTHQVYFGVSADAEGKGFADALAEGWTTLAEAMRNAGYRTFGFVTNPNVQADGFNQGFDVGDYVFENSADAARVTDAALARLGKRGEPFFGYIHYLDPHAPYDPPEPYRSLFGATPEITESDRETLRPEKQIPYLQLVVRQTLGQGMANRFTPLSDAGKETLRQWYDGDCAYADAEVGRLIASLRAAHPNTVFIITSDHGEEFWEHEGMGHGTTLYEEQIRVPLIIVGPGIAPATVDSPAEALSIYATLARLLHLDTPIAPQGEDLLGASTQASAAHSRTRGPSTDLEVDLDAMISPPSKVIRNRAASTSKVFDLQKDPAESQPSTDEAAKAALVQQLDNHAHRSVVIKPPQIERAQVPIPPDVLRMQQRLGYEVPEGEGEPEEK